MKIIMVEDNEAIIMGLEYLLTKEGYEVETARSITQAEAFLKKRDYVAYLISGFQMGTVFDFAVR